MIPLGPILFVAARTAAGGRPAAFLGLGVSWALLHLLGRLLASVFLFAAIVDTLERGFEIDRFLIGFFLSLYLSPGLLMEYVLIPLGVPQLSWIATFFLGPLESAVGLRALAATNAARTLAFGASESKWVESLLLDEPSIAWVYARAVFAWSTGQSEQARILFRSVASCHYSLDNGFLLRRLVVRAGIWCVASAIEAGDLSLLSWILRHPEHQGGMVQALGRSERGRRGHPVPISAVLPAIFWGPHRIGFLRWLRSFSPAPPPPPLPETCVDPIENALRLHAHLLRLPPAQLTEDSVRALGMAWDAAWEPAEAKIQKRLGELGGRGKVDVGEKIRKDLVSVLGKMEAPVGGARILEEAKALLWNERSRHCEELGQDYWRRLREKVPMSQAEEWTTWIRLMDAWEAAIQVAEPAQRKWLWSRCYAPTCNYTVWCHNERRMRIFANTIYRWLREEAKVVGTPDDVSLMNRNIVASR